MLVHAGNHKHKGMLLTIAGMMLKKGVVTTILKIMHDDTAVDTSH